MWKKIVFLFSLLIFCSGFAQNPDVLNLEKEVSILIKKGEYSKSQDKIISLLQLPSLSNRDEAKLYILLASTYRSLNDYPTSVDYLLQAQNIATYLDPSDSVVADINSQLAYVYFDSNQYSKADVIMKNIEKNHFKNLSNIDKAYMIMQQGYLSYLNNNYVEADNKYKQSYSLLLKESPCDLPVVLVKKMQLFGKQKNIPEVEKIYQKTTKVADSCKILKYKIYATEELYRIYNEQNIDDKAAQYLKILNDLNREFNRDEKVFNLHSEGMKYIEKEDAELERDNLVKTIVYIISSLLFIYLVIYFYRKSSYHKREVAKLDAELSQMRKELKVFTEYKISNPTDKEVELNNFNKLNDRQKELLKLMTEGLSNKEIAEKLFITESTVKYHIKNIYEILELKNRKEFFTKISKK